VWNIGYEEFFILGRGNFGEVVKFAIDADVLLDFFFSF